MGLVLDSKIRRAFSQLKPWGVQGGCQFWAYGAFILGWGWFKGGLVFQVAVHLGAGSVGRGCGPGFQKFQHRSRHLVFEIAAVFSYSENDFTRNMCLGEKIAFL